MKKVLWVSRHDLQKNQLLGLEQYYGTIDITQIDTSLDNLDKEFSFRVKEGKKWGGVMLSKDFLSYCMSFDVICVVLPIDLLYSLVNFAKDRDILVSKVTRRVNDNGETLVDHIFWLKIKSLELEVEKI